VLHGQFRYEVTHEWLSQQGFVNHSDKFPGFALVDPRLPPAVTPELYPSRTAKTSHPLRFILCAAAPPRLWPPYAAAPGPFKLLPVPLSTPRPRPQRAHRARFGPGLRSAQAAVEACDAIIQLTAPHHADDWHEYE
jgi:hypothetical protein